MSAAPTAAIKDFRSTANLTKWLTRLLWISMLLDTASIGIILLRRASATRTQEDLLRRAAAIVSEIGDAFSGALISFQLGYAVVIAAVFLYWTYRACQNSRQLGASGLRTSPAWSVAWYFMPIANLWKPYVAMKEIWQASADPAHWQLQRPARILPAWWICYLLSMIPTVVIVFYSLADLDSPALAETDLFDVFSTVAWIASTYFAIRLIGQISDMQRNRATELTFR